MGRRRGISRPLTANPPSPPRPISCGPAVQTESLDHLTTSRTPTFPTRTVAKPVANAMTSPASTPSSAQARPNPIAVSPARSRAFTLIEMLTTVAVLIIVLGLMVSLARYVRDRSANELTQNLLLRLDDLARTYEMRIGHPPEVPPILSPDDVFGNEAAVQA